MLAINHRYSASDSAVIAWCNLYSPHFTQLRLCLSQAGMSLLCLCFKQTMCQALLIQFQVQAKKCCQEAGYIRLVLTPWECNYMARCFTELGSLWFLEWRGGLEGITFPHYILAQANSSEAVKGERLDFLGTPFPLKQPDFKNQANANGKMRKKF